MQPAILVVPAQEERAGTFRTKRSRGPPKRARHARLPRLLTFACLLCIAAQSPSQPQTRPYLRAPIPSSPRTPGTAKAKKTQSGPEAPMPRLQPQRLDASETSKPPAAPGWQGWRRGQLQAGEGGPLSSVWHHVLAWARTCWLLGAGPRGEGCRAGEGLAGGGRAEELWFSLWLRLYSSVQWLSNVFDHATQCIHFCLSGELKQNSTGFTNVQRSLPFYSILFYSIINAFPFHSSPFLPFPPFPFTPLPLSLENSGLDSLNSFQKLLMFPTLRLKTVYLQRKLRNSNQLCCSFLFLLK